MVSKKFEYEFNNNELSKLLKKDGLKCLELACGSAPWAKYLSQKKIDVEYIQVNVPSGENRESNYLSINPKSGVPALELDNGVIITESMAICRYFDAIQPKPYLFGETPEERGLVEMWNRKIEID